MARRVKLFPWVVAILVVSVAVLVWACNRFYLAHEHHRQLVEKTIVKGQNAYALFGNAYHLGARGRGDEALAAYAAVMAQDNDDLRKMASFNSGNLYLARATELLETQGLSAWDTAGPLVAMAKESYQKALRIQPDWSEAKYNYHLALRLAPSTYAMRGPQQYEDEDIKQKEDSAGWPAMPGNPRGMP